MLLQDIKVGGIYVFNLAPSYGDEEPPNKDYFSDFFGVKVRVVKINNFLPFPILVHKLGSTEELLALASEIYPPNLDNE